MSKGNLLSGAVAFLLFFNFQFSTFMVHLVYYESGNG